MRYSDSILGNLLKPLSRRWFDALVDRHAGNAYDKRFGSWDHLVALVYAQLGGITSLRALEAAWNANAHHHYHLGVGALARSTLADANARRPLAIFSETFARLSGLADRLGRRQGGEMLRLIDATPIRRIRLRRHAGTKIALLTNDLERSAVEIGSLYKTRWQIELLFRWIKQHLKITTFLGRNPNAIRLQLLAAMIAYLLLRIAARYCCLKMSAIRFAELVGARLFTRTAIAHIDKPNRSNPSTAAPRYSSNQLTFQYA